ncbi:hypothetical protein GCM10009038_05660 [Salinicola rhizosphaerae]|uniref:Uncharacterized protein n=1 Tax=Salinicola rhizosphaerae TaxID=1443141 RepID=A0ABQ3DPL8_9GAMM|nr:hypothetical protein GCM10009038_05660 [Salinicola rhizosphaerae]
MDIGVLSLMMGLELRPRRVRGAVYGSYELRLRRVWGALYSSYEPAALGMTMNAAIYGNKRSHGNSF